MATLRADRRGGRGWRRAALLGAAGLLLAGCASMPGSGPVQRVDSSQRPEGESEVRVYGASPEEHANPLEIVRGFLEAVTSDETEYETAKQYLTPEGRRGWDPFLTTTVLASGPQTGTPVSEPSPTGGGETMIIPVTGESVAALDASHVYAPQEAAYSETFALRQVDGEWRIDELPDGLVMGEADFERIHRPVDAYYYADLGPEAARLGANGKNVLVADPVYVRKIDPINEMAQSLVGGPSAWLDPVVTTDFPDGVALASGAVPAIDDSGTLTARLTGVPGAWPLARCERMGIQLLHSVQELTSDEVSETRLANQAGTQLCAVSATQAEEFTPGLLDGGVERPYFLDEEQRLQAVDVEDIEPVELSGPLGRGDVALRDAAVHRHEEWAAGVSADGTSLYVAPLAGAEGLSEPVYSRPSAGEGDLGLSAPSWDGLGDLWFADRDPAGQRLLRLHSGQGEAEEIPVSGLRADQRIEALRVASDGVRIAMLISEDGENTLRLGRIERTGTGDGAQIVVDDLRLLAPELENVAAASWSGGSRLVVVGRPADGVEQWQYVGTDGSSATTPTVPGLNDVTGVAAAEDEDKPLIAETADRVAQLEDDAKWTLILQQGTGPFYPG